MYGGAAGPGKSSAILMAALQYVDCPDYAALILRRSYADLSLPGAIMDRAALWLRGTDAHWDDRDKTWTFPSGARLTFGYLAAENDKYRYQSAEFQFVGFDELTQFSASQYEYMFSRLRRAEGSTIPLRMRGATNPGGEGHAWVYERFMPDLTPEAFEFRRQTGRIFVPARLEDNPHVDREAYLESLAELDPVTRRQLEEGLWVTDPSLRPFDRTWWNKDTRFHVDQFPPGRIVGRWQSWDTATKDGQHNAYTAVVTGEMTDDYRLLITEVWQDKLQVPFLAEAVRLKAEHAARDGKLEAVVIEDKSSGTGIVQTLRLGSVWLADRLVAFKPNNYGDKVQRAQQTALWCKRGCVLLPHPGPSWLFDFEKQLFNFPNTEFKDMVDALTQLVIFLEHYLAAGWRSRQGED